MPCCFSGLVVMLLLALHRGMHVDMHCSQGIQLDIC
jgi:hypothetical protein